jgi:uncharacterized protein (UPF0335 family)
MREFMSEQISSVSAEQLKSIIERLEKLEEERGVTSGFIRDVLAEAKSEGFDPKIIKKVLRLRKMNREELLEEEELTDLYMSALGQ